MIQRIEFDHIIITYDLLFQFRAVFQHQFHIAVVHLCKDNRRRHSFSEIPPLTSLTRLPILPWRHLIIPLKASDKRFRILISHSLTDIRNAHLRVGQHVFPVLQANARQQLRKGHACDSDNPSGAVRLGKMKLRRHIFQRCRIIIAKNVPQHLIVILGLLSDFPRNLYGIPVAAGQLGKKIPRKLQAILSAYASV